MRELTEDGVRQLTAAFTNDSRIVPVNVAAAQGATAPAFFTSRVMPITTREVASRRWMVAWDGRLAQHEALATLVPYDAIMGIVHLDRPASTEEVAALTRSLGLELATYPELLAGIMHADDPLVGPPVIALGTKFEVDGAVKYARHNAFWAGERTLFLEHEDGQAESSRVYYAQYQQNPGLFLIPPKLVPPGWPGPYRFLVKARTRA